MAKNVYTIREFGVIKNASQYEGIKTSSFDEIYIPAKAFNSLFNFVLECQGANQDSEVPFTLSIKSGRQFIKAKNLVGIVETNDGVCIEILPKIYLNYSNDTVENTKKLFLKMLSHLKDSAFVSLQQAHIKEKKDFPILEVFIRSFIQETELLLSSGLKGSYISKEESASYMKGKVLTPENIRINSTKKNKFYCRFDEFSQNNPQNRLIKTTLLKLKRISKSYISTSLLVKLLSYMDGIDASSNIHNDLLRSQQNKGLFSGYNNILKWAETFLLNNSFTNFRGTTLNVAVLFPMEKIFEDYVTFLFSKYAEGFKIRAQDKSYFLVEKHFNSGKFQLRPDLFLKKEAVKQIIIDTKWKLIDELAPSKNYKITSADMYQLFAYGKKYNDHNNNLQLALIYPKNNNFSNKLEPFYYEGDLKLEVFPFDFEVDPKVQVDYILQRL